MVDGKDNVLISPEYLAICHADQRYYQGKRKPDILREKLPMALIHEGCGRVIYDPTDSFRVGQRVVMIPNLPPVGNRELYENYVKGAVFLSSGSDGFMREIVELRADRLVPYEDSIPDQLAAITEFLSVAFHGLKRLKSQIAKQPTHIAIYGDGNLSYTIALVLKTNFPETTLSVIGKHPEKLRRFSFVDNVFITGQLPADFCFDHAFECVGEEGSFHAINEIIQFIEPQGSVILMGVSEHQGPVNTRIILEKGLVFVGSSRSGRDDFKKAISFLEKDSVQSALWFIVNLAGEVSSIEDIHEVFREDMVSSSKTIFKWGY